MQKNKWLNRYRKFILIALFIISIFSILFLTLFLLFLVVLFKTEFNFIITIEKFKYFNFQNEKNLIIYLVTFLSLIHTIFIILFAHIKGKVKSKSLVKEAKEKAFGKATWDINEYENPISNKIRVRNLQLTKFEKVYNKNFTEASYITRTQIDYKKKNLEIWGIPVKKAVHSITIGSTGSGKTERIIYVSAFVNCQLEFEKKPCMVFSDPKGELHANLGSILEEQGYEILVLNLRDPMYSQSWNPLSNAYKFLISAINYVKEHVVQNTFHSKFGFESYIKKIKCRNHKAKNCSICKEEILKNNTVNNDVEPNTEKYELALIWKEVLIYQIDDYWTNDEQLAKELISGETNKLKNLAYEEVNNLSAILLNPGADDKNKQWYDGAQGLFKGFIFSMMEMIEEDIDSIAENQFNIVTVTTHLSDKDKIQKFFKKWSEGRESNQSVIAANKVLTSSSQSIGNFFSIISTSLQLFEGNELRSLLCKNNINLFEFVTSEKPKAIFMIVPDDKEQKHPLASLFISQLYQANVFKAGQNLIKFGKEQLERDVIFYLDEFGNFPAIVNFATILTVSRGRRMFFNLVLQSFEQLNSKYGADTASTIMANCLLTVYLKSASTKTHEQISKMCGDTTVEVSNSTPNIDNKTGKKNFSYHLQKKPLIEPSDIKLIFPPNKKENNKYAIVIYQEANPNIVTYEYFYKIKEIFGIEIQDKDISLNKSINFEKDYFINLFKLDIKPKINEDDLLTDNVNLNEALEKDGTSAREDIFSILKETTDQDIDKLLELKTRERNIRNDLYILQSKSEDLLSSNEKEEIKRLQKELKSLLKQI
ncbi:type IV secretory system conjugative DNA transfer family protein [Spiroplasma floricola]|uniref:Type IV secretion system protein VirD4 n=1 Tax=Spiroplasma floricola 23-6 TaxID=1336749 RepID=A0A2K8SEZ9_9MOLU|nr:type IV secretory system conjugative DNA transfer family protein [Spiroplasma floricola]AUB32016.1 type IV secretion system protein VirD4 [Spiroplasma floricola 23-6]